MKKFNVILATDLNGGLGLNNQLPWNLQVDFEFFKSIVKENPILLGVNNEPNILIMGRKTWESTDCNLLTEVISFVITSTYENFNKKQYSNTIFFPDFFSAYNAASNRVNSIIWIIGGKRIYDTALRHVACNKIYWTEIKGKFEADIFINMNEYAITWTSIVTKQDINKNDSKVYEMDFYEGTLQH
jgi:dihydrofolate reductase